MRSDDAVSPVIAVILLVAATVVLSATTYVWLGGFGGDPPQPGHALMLSSDAPLAAGTKTFTVASAQNGLHYEDLAFTRNGAPLAFGAGATDCDTGAQAFCRAEVELDATSLVRAGDQVRLTGVQAGDVLRVIDRSANAVLYTIPLG